MCVLLHLLICRALRAHIIVVEALYNMYAMPWLVFIKWNKYLTWSLSFFRPKSFCAALVSTGRLSYFLIKPLKE